MKLFLVSFIFLSGLCTAGVIGHDITVAYNSLEIMNKEIIFHNDGSIAQYMGESGILEYMAENVIIKNDGERCRFDNITYDISPSDGFNITVFCDYRVGNLTIEDNTFVLDASSPVNKIYNVTYGENEKQFVGIDAMKFQFQDEGSTAFSMFITYLKLGVMHVLSGIDHIFFIIGFTLMAKRFLSLAKNISGFTISHSVTLTLAVLGIFSLASDIVEPVIALSIFIVGMVGLFDKRKRINGFWIIFGFGLFHGLGFAGAIDEIGFPKGNLLSSLAGFNIGVEIGQLAVVLLTYPFIYFANKHGKKGALFKRLSSLLIAAAGLVWLIGRIVS